MDDPAIDEDDVEPRFILFGPATIEAGPAFSETLSAVLGPLQPAAFILRRGSIDRDYERAAAIKQCTSDHALAFLAEDDLAMELVSDGYHLTDAAKVDVTRFGLSRDLGFGASAGDHYLFGADAGLSRHDAMVAGEGGADFVAFGELDQSPNGEVIELIGWWRELATVPCLGHASHPDDIETLVEAGADFIGIGSAIWEHPEGPAAAASELGAALADSIGGKKT